MRFLLILLPLLLLASFEAGAVDYTTTGTGGNWSSQGTYVGGAGVPGENDTVTIAAGDTLTIDQHGLAVQSITFGGANAALQCSNGASVMVLEYSSETPTTPSYVAEYSGSDAQDGSSFGLAKQTWSGGIALMSIGDVLFQKGGHYPITGSPTFTGGNEWGSFGRGDNAGARAIVPYGPRPLFNMGSSNTITQTGGTATTVKHAEFSCGAALTAEPVMDRTSCFAAPCAIEFKLNVDHTQLAGNEPEKWDGTEIRGGEDFLMPTTVWNFDDPGSGSWDQGARSTTGTPWSKNEEMPAPIAYHVFESAGTYNVTSETRYGGLVVNNTIQVTVGDPDTEWPLSDTYCIANSPGGFTDCPLDTSGADGVCDAPNAGNCIITDQVDVAAQVANCDFDGGSNRCLFKAGDSFEADGVIPITTSGPTMIGKFGTGDNPEITMLTGGAIGGVSTALRLGADSKDLRLWEVDIRGDGIRNDQKAFYFTNPGSGSPGCHGPEFDNLLMGYVTMTDVGNGLNLRGNASGDDATSPYTQDCGNDNIVFYEAETVNSTYGQACFGACSGPAPDEGEACAFNSHCDTNNCVGTDIGDTCTADGQCSAGNCQYGCTGGGGGGSCGVDVFLHQLSGAVLGSDFGNRELDEHGMRVLQIKDTVIAHSDFGRVGDAGENAGCGQPRAVITIRNGISSDGWDAPRSARGDELARWYTRRFALIDNHIGACAHNGQALVVEGTSNGNDWETHDSYMVWGNLFNASGRSGAYPLVAPTGSSAATFFMAQLSGTDVLVANNAFWMNSGGSTGGTGRALRLNQPKQNGGGQTADNTPERHHVYNNSFFVPSTNLNSTPMITIDNDLEDTFLANNLAVDLDTQTFITDNGINTIECNGVDGACNVEHTSNTAFQAGITGSSPPDLDWFKLTSTYGDDPDTNRVGIIPDVLGIDIDAFEKCRSGAVPWQGIDNYGAVECFFTAFLTSPIWDNADSAIGMNLSWHRWDSTTTPFANMMKQADGWKTSTSSCFTDNGDFCTPSSPGLECYLGVAHGTTCEQLSDCTGYSNGCINSVCQQGPNHGQDCSSDNDCEGANYECTVNVNQNTPDIATDCSNQDSNGWPIDIGANACVYTEWFDDAYADGPYPTGTWAVHYDGGGTTPPTFAIGAAVQDNLSAISGNRFTFDVDATGVAGDSVQLGITSLGTPTISNLRVYPPGGFCVDGTTVQKEKFCDTARCPGGDCPDTVSCTGSETCVDIETVMEDPTTYGEVTFNPLWLSTLGQYRLLRFMTWNKTNHSRVKNYTDTTQESYYTYDRNTDWPSQVPVATMVDLCNDVNADCHINIPSLATDAYISAFADDVAYSLNSNLKLYLEWSNEVWNSQFVQWRYSFMEANDELSGFTTTGCDPQTGSFEDRNDCAQDWYAKRTYEMCELAQAEFDAAGRGSDLVCVFARRISTSGTEVANSLACDRWTAAPNGNCYTGTDLDVIAVNSYLGDAGAGCGSTCAPTDNNAGAECTVNSECDVTPGDGQGTCGVYPANLCTAMASDIANQYVSGAGGGIWEPAEEFIRTTGGGRVMVYEGGSNNEGTTGAACLALATEADSCVIEQYQSALDGWRDLDANANIDTDVFLFFDHGGPLQSSANYGNLYGHRGSNEGTWPKESAIVAWERIAGNECWWAGCEIAAALDPPARDPGVTPPTLRGTSSGGGASFSLLPIEQMIINSLLEEKEDNE